MTRAVASSTAGKRMVGPAASPTGARRRLVAGVRGERVGPHLSRRPVATAYGAPDGAAPVLVRDHGRTAEYSRADSWWLVGVELVGAVRRAAERGSHRCAGAADAQ